MLHKLEKVDYVLVRHLFADLELPSVAHVRVPPRQVVRHLSAVAQSKSTRALRRQRAGTSVCRC